MIKYQDLLGKTAYSLEEGRQWGKVIELFVDKKTFAVTGMVVKGDEDRFLPLAAAKKIDESVVFASSADFTAVSSAEQGVVRGGRITGLRALTEEGNEKGTVVSFYFKKEGPITHYELSANVIKENFLMEQDGVVRMGDDAMIITEEAAAVAAEMKTKDSLRRTMSQIGRKFSIFAFGAKKSMKEAAEKYGPGVKDLAEKTKQGAKAAADKYGPKIKEGAKIAGAKFQEFHDKAKPKIKDAAEKTGQKVKEAADTAGPKMKEAGEKAKDAVKGAIKNMTKKKDDEDEPPV